MKKVIRLTESDLVQLVKKVIREQIETPIAKTVPQSSQEQKRQERIKQAEAQKQAAIKKAQDNLTTHFVKNQTINLYDRENGGKYLGAFSIVGQVPLGSEVKNEPDSYSDVKNPNKPKQFTDEQLYDIDTNTIKTAGRLTFRVMGLEGNKRNRNKQLNLTFNCQNGHALSVGKINRPQFGKFMQTVGDAFNFNHSNVYAPDLTRDLLTVFCQATPNRKTTAVVKTGY